MNLLGERLVAAGKITEGDRDAALELQKNRPGFLGEILVEEGRASEEEILDGLIEQIPAEAWVHLARPTEEGGVDRTTPLERKVVHLVPRDVMIEHKCVPVRLDESESTLTVGMVAPDDEAALAALAEATGKVIDPVPTPLKEIEALWREWYNLTPQELYGSDLDLSRDVRLLVGREGDAGKEQSVIKLVDLLIEKAVAFGASDIHFDPFEKDALVRYRVDGVLYTVATLAPEVYVRVASRVKVMGRMDVGDRRVAQDGRAQVPGPRGAPLDLRISVLPVYCGERIVLRLLDKSNLLFDLRNLGIHKRDYPRFQQNLERPTGLILVTGPTGSGKTTTLYSMVNSLNDWSQNIVSIEDPVEFTFRGVAQVQVDNRAGVSFASALRAMLRQDPNIVMVGEIRDEETADICVRAALTGHLVLATAHTNDAPSAIARLLNMGIRPYLLASSLNMVIAQRLARRVCPECRVPDRPDPRVLLRLGLRPKEVAKLRFTRGAGCASCKSIGYRGRVALVETLFATGPLRDVIARGGSTSDVRLQVRKEKMISLALDGIYKASQGLTTIDEVVTHAYFDT